MTGIRRAGAAGLLAVFGLAGCSNPAYLGSGGDYQNTKNGALAGALVGAGVGAIAGGDNIAKNAAIGAIAGAALGGGIGATLDQQAADLRQNLSNDGIEVRNTGESLIVSLPQDITFDTDSATVRPELRADLDAVAANLIKYGDSSLQIIGNTDNVGDAAYNQALSERRAASVASILVADGVGPSRLTTLGRGEDAPVASNLTPEGRAQNRRVDIIVVPTQA
ncbi:MAG: OmpA family protein [Marinibacterium sp.]